MPVGRPPKPTNLKALAGNPGKRKLNDSEPQFGGQAICPTHLDTEARREWKRVSSELSSQGLLTSVDRSALAAYCQAWSRWVLAEKELRKQGLVVTAKSGYPMPNPYVAIANTAMEHMRKFASEFGMTPSSRSRISVADKPQSADPLALFMGAPKPSPQHDEDDLQPTIN